MLSPEDNKTLTSVGPDSTGSPRYSGDPGDDYLVTLALDTEADLIVAVDRDLLDHRAGVLPRRQALRDAPQRLAGRDRDDGGARLQPDQRACVRGVDLHGGGRRCPSVLRHAPGRLRRTRPTLQPGRPGPAQRTRRAQRTRPIRPGQAVWRASLAWATRRANAPGWVTARSASILRSSGSVGRALPP